MSLRTGYHQASCHWTGNHSQGTERLVAQHLEAGVRYTESDHVRARRQRVTNPLLYNVAITSFKLLRTNLSRDSIKTPLKTAIGSALLPR
jgi:hypothetical protein